jgi:hypothetical protein
MEKYAAAWNIQWIMETMAGTHPKSMTGYANAFKLRFEDRDANDEVHADLKNVQ